LISVITMCENFNFQLYLNNFRKSYCQKSESIGTTMCVEKKILTDYQSLLPANVTI